MELHKDTTEHFIEYLLRHNYPKNSLALDWGNGKCSVDIAILAEDGITPVTLFEIKGKRNRESIRYGVLQLKKVIKTFDVSVQCNLVFGLSTQPYFEVVNVTDLVYADSEIDFSIVEDKSRINELISYDIMNISAKNKFIQKEYKEKETKKDYMRFLCWVILPGIAFVLILLDALEVYIFNVHRLIVLGAIVLVILLPFFSELSLLDFSFKRK